MLWTVTASPWGSAQEVPATDIQARENHSAYYQDQRGNIVRSADGLCWRSGYWTTEDAVMGCDGSLVPPVSKVIAPPLPAGPVPAVTSSTETATIPAHPVASGDCVFMVTLAGDSAFSFNSARLKQGARKQINAEVVPRLQHCHPTVPIAVTGYTDRLGSPQANSQLSKERAQAVASYLAHRGIDASFNIVGAGASEAERVCSDRLPRRALVACLAPNRRVVIEVGGTRN